MAMDRRIGTKRVAVAMWIEFSRNALGKNPRIVVPGIVFLANDRPVASVWHKYLLSPPVRRWPRTLPEPQHRSFVTHASAARRPSAKLLHRTRISLTVSCPACEGQALHSQLLSCARVIGERGGGEGVPGQFVPHNICPEPPTLKPRIRIVHSSYCRRSIVLPAHNIRLYLLPALTASSSCTLLKNNLSSSRRD